MRERSLLNKASVTTLIAAATVLAAMVFTTSVSAKKLDAAAAAKPGDNTITEIVVADDGEFDVLQAAVIRAGLADALNGNRQFTVFAPTDQAFVDSLGVADEQAAIDAVNGLDIDTLTDVLLLHVTSGRRTSTSVLAAPSYNMLSGDKLAQSDVLAAGINSTDTSAKNGVVHVIDSVLGL